MGANLVPRGVPFAGCLRVRVSVYADDIIAFVSHQLDIKAVEKAYVRYEEIAGAKINFDSSEDLRLVTWKVNLPQPGFFY